MALSKLKILNPTRFGTSKDNNISENHPATEKSPPIMERQEFQISTMGFLQMQDKIETQKGENKILRQKLQSKAEALLIITKELEKVRGECDEYRELVQRLQEPQCSTSKTFASEDPLDTLNALTSLPIGVNMKVVAATDSSESFNSRAFRDQTVASRFSALRNENKRLLLERENVKRILNEREEDIRLLRLQAKKNERRQRNDTKEVFGGVNDLSHDASKLSRLKSMSSTDSTSSNVDVVRQLEVLQMKYDKLKHDFQSLLDEKEDLIQERDSYKCKLHRLNHSMGALLKCNGHQVLDLDGILSENRFLQESLEQIREEKQLSNEIGRKYKLALEQATQRKRMGSNSHSQDLRSPTRGNKYASILDDIKALMARTSFPCPKDLDISKPDQLQELCMSLLETLNDRMLQFTQQKRANKQLMSRLEEVEGQIQIATNLEIGQLILHPSSFLMKDYTNANVDEDVNDIMNGISPVNEALAVIDSQLKDGQLSHQSRFGSTEHFSPEVADLYKRFKSLTTNSPSQLDSIPKSLDFVSNDIHTEKEKMEKISSPPKLQPPPDLIAQDFVGRGISYHNESLSISDIENDQSDHDDASVASNEIEEHEIILPEHLQQLVDKAMVEIDKECSE